MIMKFRNGSWGRPGNRSAKPVLQQFLPRLRVLRVIPGELRNIKMSEEENLPNNWTVVLWYIHICVLSMYGWWILFAHSSWLTFFYVILLISIACVGVTIGAHRYWAHKAFECTMPVRILLLIGHTLAGVGPLYNFVLYHRIHHKYYGTEHDPYNHKKGFMYCHFVANMQFAKTDTESERIKRQIDMRDIESDVLVQAQQKLYWLWFLAGIFIPAYIPIAYWNEWFVWSLITTTFVRFFIAMNVAWLVNSSFLIWNLEDGAKYPPTDNLIFIVSRTRWPAYHYLFPWDYKSGEFGCYSYGWGTCIIKLFYDIGLVSHLRTVSSKQLRNVFANMTEKTFNLENAIQTLKDSSEEDALNRSVMFHG